MAKKQNRSPQIRVRFDRTEGDYAILRLDDGQELLWPTNKMPLKSQEGNDLILSLLTEEELAMDRQDLARSILEKIISGE